MPLIKPNNHISAIAAMNSGRYLINKDAQQVCMSTDVSQPDQGTTDYKQAIMDEKLYHVGLRPNLRRIVLVDLPHSKSTDDYNNVVVTCTLLPSSLPSPN